MYGGDYSVLPVSVEDKLICAYNHISKGQCIGLFVGAFGRANWIGIEWFLKNTKLNKSIKILIVGKNFENHINEIKNINTTVDVEVVGTTEDLDKYYRDSDFVLAPIIIGAGMKIKIAEALMYGKTVIGTQEAFVGYEVDFSKVGACSNNIQELDEAIMRCKKGEYGDGFNPYSRQVYLDKYSIEATDKIFQRELK